MTNQMHSLRFQDSTSQAHYYEADEWNHGEYAGEYPAYRENAYYDAIVEQERIALQNKDGVDMVWLRDWKPFDMDYQFRTQPEWEPCRKNCVNPWGITGPVRDGFWEEMGTEIPF